MHEANYRVKMWGGGQGWFPPNNQFTGNQQFNQQVRKLTFCFILIIISMNNVNSFLMILKLKSKLIFFYF